LAARDGRKGNSVEAGFHVDTGTEFLSSAKNKSLTLPRLGPTIDRLARRAKLVEPLPPPFEETEWRACTPPHAEPFRHKPVDFNSYL
jgi:hypothetical protein